MKVKRNHFVLIVTLMLLLCCSILFVACSSESMTPDDDTDINEAEYTNVCDLGLTTLQSVTALNESGSKNSAVMAVSSSVTHTGIYIGGGEITSSRPSGDDWWYDFNTNTLTLNGYYSPSSNNNTLGLTRDLFPDIPSLSCQGHLVINSKLCTSLTIKVKGEYATCFGEIDDADEYDKDNYIYYGIYAPGVDLILDIEDDYAPMKYNPVYYPLQIYTNRDAVYCKSLTITGGGGLRADSCIGSGINCQDLSVNNSRLIARTQHGNNIYHGSVGHITAAILASGSVTFAGASVNVYVQNTAPKVGAIWAAYMIDVYGIKAGTMHLKGGANVNVEMTFSSDVTQNVGFKATGIQASGFTSYDGGKVHTKISSNDSIPNNAYLSGFNIEDYAYFLSDYTTIAGELSKSASKTFKLDSFIQPFCPLGSLSTSIEDTKYNYTANVNALYLRNNNGTLQYARNVSFNDATTL